MVAYPLTTFGTWGSSVRITPLRPAENPAPAGIFLLWAEVAPNEIPNDKIEALGVVLIVVLLTPFTESLLKLIQEKIAGKERSLDLVDIGRIGRIPQPLVRVSKLSIMRPGSILDFGE